MEAGTEDPESSPSKPVEMCSVMHDHGSMSKSEWTVEDDFILTRSIAHVGDIDFIVKTVKFSKKYTAADLQNRWYNLMYDDEVSAQVKNRFAQCSDPERFLKLQMHIPFSLAENNCLDELPGLQPGKKSAKRLLKDAATTFLPSRTPQQLLDQHAISIMSTTERHASFDARISSGDANVNDEAGIATRADSTSSVMPDVYLKGRVSIFPITQNRVVIGRSTRLHKVDVNLSEEEPSTVTISRNQALITRDELNRYQIKNTARRPIIVNGNVLFEGNYATISSLSVIQVAHIKLVFKCNH